FTAVMVTHDQSEALALGDRLAVMREGRLEQVGGPQEIFERPRSEYVAAFVGMSNRLVAQRNDGGWRVGPQQLTGLTAPATASVAIRFRPEHVTIVPVDSAERAPDLSLR